MENLEFVKVKAVKTPTRGTDGSAGIDFYIPDNFGPMEVYPGWGALIPSGIHVKVPKGFALIGFNKSGVATKKGLQIGACVIDEDYQGEIHLHLVNTSPADVELNPGEKIAQFILLPVNYAMPKEVPTLKALYDTVTERGAGGFGSTGSE